MTGTSSLHPTPSTRHRFHLLDALRGIAAVLVMVSHDKYLAHHIGLHSGFLAVDFFFCLSGFVIASSYENRLRAGLRIRDFFAARIIRLYPVYFFAIGLAFILELTLFRDLGSSAFPAFLTAVFLIPNLHTSPSVYLFPLDPPSWSLLMEMIANIGYVLLIKFRLGSASLLSLVAAVPFVLISSLVFQGQVLSNFGILNTGHYLSFGIARVLPSFLLGVLALRLFRSGTRLFSAGPSSLRIPLAIAIVLVFILESPFPAMRTNVFYLLCIVLLFPALTYLGASSNPPRQWIRLCVVLGDLSYPLYLIHAPFLVFADSRLFLHSNSAVHFGLSIFAMLLAILAAMTLAQSFDAPVRRTLTNMYRNATASPLTTV